MSNAPSPFFQNITQSNASSVNSQISDKVSSTAKGGFKNILRQDGTIKQTERLFSTRARYAAETANYVTEANGVDTNGVDSAGNRGDWAFIKLITSKEQGDGYKNGSTKRDVTYKHLIGKGSIGKDLALTELTNTGYDGFMITSVSCTMSEKVQISEVFGDGEVVYYFGRQPLIFNISGLLIDSVDNDWFYDWLCVYNDFLRGSQTARNYELLKIVLPNMTIVGTISAFSWQQDSIRDTDIPFSFQFIAKTVIPKPAKTKPIINSNKIKGVNFENVAAFLPQSGINSLKGQVADWQSVLQNPMSSLRDRGIALARIGSGVGGATGADDLSIAGTLKGYQDTINGWSSGVSKFAADVSVSAMYSSVTSALTGIRTNLFSPVYGVLSSLTKLVSNAFNSVNSIFNALITPVRNILRDITNISRQSIALVNLVNNSIKGVGRNINAQLRGTKNDFLTAIKTLGRAAGVIAAAPITAGQSLNNMFSSGAVLASSPFLSSKPKLTFVRPSINITGKPPVSVIALLQSTPVFTPAEANSL